MEHDYELFEKFPDGSSLWRDSVFGAELTVLRLRELARKSKHHFYALDLTTGEVLDFHPERDALGMRTLSPSEERSSAQEALAQ